MGTVIIKQIKAWRHTQNADGGTLQQAIWFLKIESQLKLQIYLPFHTPLLGIYLYIWGKQKKGKYTRPFTAVLLVIIKVHKQYKYPVGRWLNTEYYAPLKKEKGWGWSFLCTDTARCLEDSTKWKIKLQNSVCRLLPFVKGKWEYTYSFIFVLKTGKINLRN